MIKGNVALCAREPSFLKVFHKWTHDMRPVVSRGVGLTVMYIYNCPHERGRTSWKLREGMSPNNMMCACCLYI